MRLLFDQNLSAILGANCAVAFPGSAHVRPLGLMNAPDPLIWDYAKQNGFVLANNDWDFLDLSTRLGSPPKVIPLSMGNCGTSQVATALLAAVKAIADFVNSSDCDCLVLRQ